MKAPESNRGAFFHIGQVYNYSTSGLVDCTGNP